MTISSTTTKNSYSGNGSNTTFAYGFYIPASTDIQVIVRSSTGTETVKSEGTGSANYSITGVGNSSGGNVVFVTAPLSTDTVVLRRNTAKTQATDYVANDPFPAETHEDALDKLTIISQDLQEQVDRSLCQHHSLSRLQWHAVNGPHSRCTQPSRCICVSAGGIARAHPAAY